MSGANKIIGVEFRLDIFHPIVGRQNIEVFLHPMELTLPAMINGNVEGNFTVHSSQGDDNCQNFTIRNYSEIPGPILSDRQMIEWQQFKERLRR